MIPVAPIWFVLCILALFLLMLSCYSFGKSKGSPRQIVKTNLLDPVPLQQHPDAEVVAELTAANTEILSLRWRLSDAQEELARLKSEPEREYTGAGIKTKRRKNSGI